VVSERLVEIAVVGAGITGMAMTLALAKAGLPVTLVAAGPLPQADTAPPADGRTAALLQPAVALLTRLAVFDPQRLGAEPLYRLRIVNLADHAAPSITFDAAEIGLDAFGWNIPNGALAARLAAVVAKEPRITVHDRAPLGSVVETRDRLLLRAGQEVIAARLVIGADGRDSVVRDTAAIGMTDRDRGQTAIVCRFSHQKPHRNISTELHKKGGPFTMVPLPGRNSSLVWVDTDANSAERIALGDAAFRAAMAEHATPWLGAILGVSIRHAYPIRARLAKSITAPRRALVGEAAHVMSPLGAQGLNLSLRDVATLADHLARHQGDPGADTLLETYAAARATDVRLRFWGVDSLNMLVKGSSLPFRQASSLAFGLLDRLPPARRALMHGLMAGA
jgi:2-octaprenyl-6-methoxyphenol hydroxylase